MFPFRSVGDASVEVLDEREPGVFVQEAGTKIHARMKAGIAGHEGTFVDCRELGKAMLGRVLSAGN